MNAIQRQIVSCLVILIALVGVTPSSHAQSSAWGQGDGPAYEVSDLQIEYVRELGFLPPIDTLGVALGETVVTLEVANGALVAPRGGDTMTRPVGEFFGGDRVLIHASALSAIIETFVEQQAQTDPRLRFVIGPRATDVDPGTWADRRPVGETRLRLAASWEGPFYPISSFELQYTDSPGLAAFPPLDEVLGALEVKLVPTEAGYVSWEPGGAATSVRLADIAPPARPFSAGAIQSVMQAVSTYFIDNDFMAIRAIAAAGELDANLGDARGGRTSFLVEVRAPNISQVRTLASGNRIAPEQRVDNELHDLIRARSPLKPIAEGNVEASVLRKSVLDDYLFRLSRLPGRRADAGLSAGDDPLTLSLDYIVSENQPLLLYAQVSNTGTEQTNEWRERFGLFYNQLTNNDDFLNVEFVTAGFENTFSFAGTYDAPIGKSERWRWRAYGLYSEYEASDVGFAGERFSGDSTTAGLEAAYNIHQDGPLFIDVFGGMRYLGLSVSNQIVALEGDADLYLPYVGARLERHTEEARTDAVVMVEFNPNLGDDTTSELNSLGRLFPDEDWTLLRWDLSHEFFLEPVFNRAAWEDISTRESSTLAHELAVSFRGQYAMENRLIPQLTGVVGGLYSVRGYDESIAAADTLLIANLEYRFHLPRSFAYQEDTGTDLFSRSRAFRWVPQQPYGAADWDLVFKAFIDAGWTYNTDRRSFETDETLLGTGIGLDFSYRTNLRVRLDWGFTLHETTLNDDGENRLHVVASVFF